MVIEQPVQRLLAVKRLGQTRAQFVRLSNDGLARVGGERTRALVQRREEHAIAASLPYPIDVREHVRPYAEELGELDEVPGLAKARRLDHGHAKRVVTTR